MKLKGLLISFVFIAVAMAVVFRVAFIRNLVMPPAPSA
jgi:hypothetical protein